MDALIRPRGGADDEQRPVVPAPDRVPAPASRRLEVVLGLTALAAAATYLYLTAQITTRVQMDGLPPRWWPTVLGTCAAVLAALLLLRAALRPPTERPGLNQATRAGWGRVVATAVLCIVFIVAWDTLGFLVTAPLFLLALLLTYGARHRLALVLLPLGVTGGIYLVFAQVLRVPL